MTEAGQFIAQSLRYFRAAGVIRHSTSWGVQMQSPTLHLVAHGIELLLKFPLISWGKTQEEVKKDHGHDLRALWQLHENLNFRTAVYREGEISWAVARNSGAWPDDNFDDDPSQIIDKALESLAVLHGKRSSFALRYTLEKDTLAPRPAFLIDTFGGVAERIVMNPKYLDQ